MGAETTAVEKIYRYAEHCILSAFTGKSSRLLQDYVNLCNRAAPCEPWPSRLFSLYQGHGKPAVIAAITAEKTPWMNRTKQSETIIA